LIQNFDFQKQGNPTLFAVPDQNHRIAPALNSSGIHAGGF